MKFEEKKNPENIESLIKEMSPDLKKEIIEYLAKDKNIDGLLYDLYNLKRLDIWRGKGDKPAAAVFKRDMQKDMKVNVIEEWFEEQPVEVPEPKEEDKTKS